MCICGCLPFSVSGRPSSKYDQSGGWPWSIDVARIHQWCLLLYQKVCSWWTTLTGLSCIHLCSLHLLTKSFTLILVRLTKYKLFPRKKSAAGTNLGLASCVHEHIDGHPDDPSATKTVWWRSAQKVITIGIRSTWHCPTGKYRKNSELLPETVWSWCSTGPCATATLDWGKGFRGLWCLRHVGHK